MARISTLISSLFYASLVVLQVSGVPFSLPEPDPAFAVQVIHNGRTFINKGLVAFGFIPSDAKDSTGDTLGGFGSAIALSSFRKRDKDVFEGTLWVQPDRGFNVANTVDYQARRHKVDFVMEPYYGSANLAWAESQKTLQLDYRKTILHYGPFNLATTGLDPLSILPPENQFPELPIANDTYQHVSVDAEGLVLNHDGSVWTSDEYGPLIYRFGKHGELLQVITPPVAFLPHDSQGHLNFSTTMTPKTGRQGNQGFEGLTIDRENNILYTLLQSALEQDGGTSKKTAQYTRLLAFDLNHDDTPLVGEWVVKLPSDSGGSALGSSDILFLSENLFLFLPRDGSGRGGGSTLSGFKQANILDISQATDIHGTSFDTTTPVAPGGVLASGVTAASGISFVDYLNTVQLARFGLHNGDPNDRTLICGKWESLAIAPVGDPSYPDDYFLFTAADNDFITTNGVSVGVPYNAGLDNDNQVLVFRVTLPGVHQEVLDFEGD